VRLPVKVREAEIRVKKAHLRAISVTLGLIPKVVLDWARSMQIDASTRKLAHQLRRYGSAIVFQS
jgi:hypothetical protein